jgi:DNA polymerase-3 subunit gamma/tau
MSYQVIARKWRPQSFDETVGQETVTRTLRNALATGRIAHAFLFSGVRGVGKTTTARILAKALNCHHGISEQPCNECPSCLEITAGNSVDVHEIDAASNRGIDSIRELRESVRYGTARDRFKIYIVDEVHMLTNEAFNALLKTLEEPPSHVKFILATTEFHKIPATITSRCQKYDFKPIPFAAIQERLRLICDTEEVKASDYVIGVVAGLAQGSMRDGQSALDQLIAFGGKELRDEDVKALLGVVDQSVVANLIDGVRLSDRSKLIQGIQELAESGISPQILCSKLIERIRSLLVCKVSGWDPVLLQLPDSEKESLMEQAEGFSELDLIRFYDVLNRTLGDLRYHSQPGVHLELALLKLVEVAHLSRIEDVLRDLRLGTGKNPGGSSGPGGRSGIEEPRPRNTQRPGQGTASSGSPPTVQRAAPAPRPETAPAAVKTEDPSPPGPSRDLADEEEPADPDYPAVKLGDGPLTVRTLMGGLKDRFNSLYAQLQTASDILYSDGRLKVRFPAGDQIHASMLDPVRLSEAFASILGSKPAIEVEVDDESGKDEAPGAPTDDPRVRSFIQKFPGKVVVRKLEG